MRYYPIELDLKDREALVVGMGPEVPAKIDRLLAAGAKVTLIADAPIDADLEQRTKDGALRVERRGLEDRDLEGKAIVFLAPFHTPEEEAIARRLHETAVRDGRLVCSIDRPECSTFVNAAVISAPGLIITVSTEGKSPGTARRIREDLTALFSDPRWARYIAALGEMRARLPRGERAARMAEAVKGFAVEARLRFPGWFDREEA